MNRNPFVPQPSFTPQQPPLPPGPPPPQPGQPDYSAYWQGGAAQQQSQAQGVAYPQWNPAAQQAPPPPRPPAEQNALFANYGYGGQAGLHWQQQQHRQNTGSQYPPPPQPVVQAPPQPAQPGYNPYQPPAGYVQPYVPQPGPQAQPMGIPPPPHYSQMHPQPPQQTQYYPQPPLPQQPPPTQPQHQRNNNHLHHTPPHPLPPAKRQRFDGPNHGQNSRGGHQFQPPAQPQFQQPANAQQQQQGMYGPQGPAQGGHGRGGAPMGSGRGGGRGAGAGAGNNRGGRGGSFNRGGMNQNRGSRPGSMFIGGNSGGGGGGPRGGGGGQTTPLRGHSSQGAFRNNRRGGFTGGGGQNINGSFRGGGGGRNANQNRRHDGGGGSGGAFGARDSSFSNINGAGKKSEHLADFKIIGLEMRELGWSWGVLPSEKLNFKSEGTDVIKAEEEAEGDAVAKSQQTQQTEQTQTNTLADSVSDLEKSAEAIKQEPAPDTDASTSLSKDTSTQSVATSHGSVVPAPPSRMRIYFHTPVTPDDSNPHSLNASTSFSIPTDSNSRKGKRKKSEDDDGDLEDSGRGKRPAPSQMAGNSDTASVDMDVAGRGSVAPSMAGTSESGDWLMAHIAQDDREDEGNHEGEVDDDKLNVSQILDANDDVATEVADDENDVGNELLCDEIDADADGHTESIEGHGQSDQHQNTVHEPQTQTATEPVGEIDASSGNAVDAATVPNDLPSAVTATATSSGGEQSANDIGNPDTQVPHLLVGGKPLQPFDSVVSSNAGDDAHPPPAPTSSDDGPAPTEDAQEKPPADNGLSVEQEHLPEPPASPTSNTLLSTSSGSTYGGDPGSQTHSPQSSLKLDGKTTKIPSANRLSISYAAGTRRLVIDAAVVQSLKVFRQEARIEAVVNTERDNETSLKGIFLEGLSETTGRFASLPSPLDEELSSDITLPTFYVAPIPSQITLLVHLDTDKPFSDPRWVKSGDIQEWHKSTFGRMFWVAGEAAADGWERKIEVVDPDPAPTIWTVLENWAAISPAGIETERQRFLKTHMTEEPENILEILLRLVRGERATPFSGLSAISPASGSSLPAALQAAISGPVDSSGGFAHGEKQTHVSLAVLALWRMALEYARKAALAGDGGAEAATKEVEERVGEIIRCIPAHLLHKSLDGMFKEWKVEKKGGRT